VGSSGSTSDRAIATAPTGVAGNVIQLSMVNNSGAARGGIRVGYDIKVLQAGTTSGSRTPPAGIPPGSDELSGYWLFYSLDNGANFTAVNPLIPVGQGPSTNPVIPNAVGVYPVPSTSIAFGSGVAWQPGQNLLLRWVDDNAFDPSPDPIIGLDNFTVSPVPEPSSLLCVSAVGLLAGVRAVRKRFGRTA